MPHGAAWPFASTHCRCWAACQIPDKSGLPSGSRGAGAVKSGLPSAFLGMPSVGYFNHCAATTDVAHMTAAKASAGTRDICSSLSTGSLHPLVRLLVLQTELVDELGVHFKSLPHLHGERAGIHLRIVDGDFEFERPEVRPAHPLGHLRPVAHRAAAHVDPHVV